MPKIPIHVAGNLASEQVGVPSADQSGGIVGTAFADAMRGVQQVLQTRKDNLDRLDVAEATAKYQTEMTRAELDIFKDPSVSSVDVESRIREKMGDVRDTALSSIQDGGVRQLAASQFNLEDERFIVRALQKRVDLENQEAYKKIFGTREQLITSASTSGDLDVFGESLLKIQEQEPLLGPFFDHDPDKMQKVTQNAIDALVRQTVSRGIDRGEELKMQSWLSLGKFGEASEATQTSIEKTLTTALKSKQYRDDLETQARVLMSNDDIVKQYDTLQLGDLEHELSAKRYEYESGEHSEKQKTYLEQEITTLQQLYNSKLTQASIQATDELDTRVNLEAKFIQLIKGEGLTARRRPDVTLDEIATVRNEVMKAFADDQKISKKTFDKLYSGLTSVLLRGFVKDNFSPNIIERGLRRTPGSLNELFAEGEGKDLFLIYNAAKNKKGEVDQQTIMDAFDEYLDDKTRSGALAPERASQYVTKARLRRSGFAVDVKPGDLVPIGDLGVFPFRGVQNGEAQFEVSPEVFQQIQIKKAQKANAGR